MFNLMKLKSYLSDHFYTLDLIKPVLAKGLSLICVISSLSTMPLSFAEEKPTVANSSDLQAAFVYNFMLFSRWPEVKEDRILCTAGQNRDSLNLKNLEGKELNHGYLHVKSVITDSEVGDCDALFIASLEYIHLSDIVKDSPVLVFSNLMPDYADNIAVLISNSGNRVVFDVRMSSLHRSSIHLSASVLRLARSTL